MSISLHTDTFIIYIYIYILECNEHIYLSRDRKRFLVTITHGRDIVCDSTFLLLECLMNCCFWSSKQRNFVHQKQKTMWISMWHAYVWFNPQVYNPRKHTPASRRCSLVFDIVYIVNIGYDNYRLYILIHVHKCLYIYMWIYVYIYIYVNMYIYIWVYIYIYTDRQ